MSNQTQSPARRCVPASLSPRPKIFRTTCAETRDCGGIRGDAQKSRRENDLRKEPRTWEKRVRREKTEKKDVDWTNDFFFPCADSRFSETASRTRRERRNTRPLTWHTKRRQAEQPSCVSRNRRTQVSRVASRDSLLFAKSKKKALSSTSARAICARRHTARHARPAETHESTRPRAHVRPASRQRLAQAGPRPAGELRETRSSDEPTRACGIFLNHEQETGRGRRPRR